MKLLALLLCGILSGHIYANLTTVENVDRVSDIVTCVDYNGNLWEFEGCENWTEGDLCNLVMFDNNTDEITDDIIVRENYERVDF